MATLGLWRFNGNMLDASGNAYHAVKDPGQSSADPTFGGSGGSSYAIFNGTNNVILTPAIIYSFNEFSVSFYINPYTTINYNQWMGLHTATDWIDISTTGGWGTFVVHTETNGGIYTGTLNTTRLTPTEIPANTYVDGKLCHITFTYKSNVGKFYKNGVLVASKTGMTTPSMANCHFWIGVNTAGNIIMNGTLKDVFINSVEKSPAQIKNEYSRIKGCMAIL